MTMIPETRYAKGPDGRIAYQVVGEGPLDLFFSPEAPRTIDVMWGNPRIAHLLESLASFSRLICFDPRGFGVSDQMDLSALLTPDQWVDDFRAVLDAVNSPRAVVFCHGLNSPFGQLFSATYPNRVSALILFNAYARWARGTAYPCGMPEETSRRMVASVADEWGTGKLADYYSPSLAREPKARAWYARFERLGLPPRTAQQFLQYYLQLDYRSLLSNIRVPTLVLHRAGDRFVRPCHGKYLAEHIQGAKYVELPGEDHMWFGGDTDAVVNEVREFLTGERFVPEENRVLATVLFVDIVDSTRRAAELGDHHWRELLQSFQESVRREVARHRGHEIDTAGDGFFARFDGPTRAVRCASEIRKAVHELGVTVRTGLHTGECELMGGDKVGGIAVHIGARVAAVAQADEILVSSTVKDLGGGSGLKFADHGMHTLKGVPGEWRLFALERLK